MPAHDIENHTGTITAVFAHRFVVETPNGLLLADLTPKGAERFALRVGDEVTIEGEKKPSELKVGWIAKKGGRPVEIEHKKPHEHHEPPHHRPADPKIAARSAEAAGYTCLGEPRRKPKHFEQLAIKNEETFELHIELDGHVRKSKPVHRDDAKWAHELAAVA